MKKSIALIVLVLGVFVSSNVKAQESDLGNWLILIGGQKIAPGLNFHYEVQHRNYNAIGDLEQLLLRTGIGYNLTEGNNNLLLGYGFIRSENYVDTLIEKDVVNEHRVFQQFITKHQAGRVSVQHRYRFEQRFIEDVQRLRFRYFLAANVPISNPTLTDNTLYLSAYNEIFIGRQRSFTNFDRNRLYGGLGYKLNSNIKFELGYMNQFFSTGGRDQVNVFVYVSM